MGIQLAQHIKVKIIYRLVKLYVKVGVLTDAFTNSIQIVTLCALIAFSRIVAQ